MQTFLPLSDFAATAAALDRQRLGNQRLEAIVLLRGHWPHHPASKMWRGHRGALALYGLAICDEWVRRGYRDTRRSVIEELLDRYSGEAELPGWLGSPELHRSHQSNLIRKLPEHYAPLFPGVPGDLPYVWPGAA